MNRAGSSSIPVRHVQGSPDAGFGCGVRVLELRHQVAQVPRLAGRRDGGGRVVDNVVRGAGEPVQRVDGRTPPGRQEPGRQKVAAAVGLGQVPAVQVVLLQDGIGDAGRCQVVQRRHRAAPTAVWLGRGRDWTPVMRSAASRPDTITIGTPTPGWVLAPQKTRFSMCRLSVG